MSKNDELVPRDMLPYVHHLIRVLHTQRGTRLARLSQDSDLYWYAVVNRTRFPGLNGTDADDDELKLDLLEAALSSFSNQETLTPTLDDVNEELKGAIAAHKGLPLKVYQAVFPLHTQEGWVLSKRSFSVRETRFERLGHRRACRLPGWAMFSDQAKRTMKLCSERADAAVSDRFTWWAAEVRAPDPHRAFARAAEDFELLRATLNFACRHSRSIVRWGGIPGHPEPLATVLPAPVYAVFEGGEEPTMWYSQHRHDYCSGGHVPDEAGPLVTSTLARMHRVPKDLRGVLEQMLLQYGEAMDTTDWRIAYLSLWQVLETAVRSYEDNVRFDQARRRMCCLLNRGKAPGIGEPLLHGLEDLRHALVHRGRFTQEGFECANALRLVAERAIDSLLSCCRYIRTKEELVEFYEQGVCQSRKLQGRAAIIARLLREREETAAGIEEDS